MNEKAEERWRLERQRFDVLEQIYGLATDQMTAAVDARQATVTIDIKLPELFRTVHDLTDQGYIDYLGAGPRVALTSRAVTYIEKQAGRRRSIRNGERSDLVMTQGGRML